MSEAQATEISEKDGRTLFQRATDWLFGYDFFISYCRADGRDYALALEEKLKGQGFSVFLDSSEYAIGDNWREQGKRALKKTSRLILVGTPEAVKSEPVEAELRVFGALKRRIFAIDIGGALDPQGREDGLFRYLDPDMLRAPEHPGALRSGPSDRLIQDIRNSFDLVRQDEKRVRGFAIATLVFAAVAITAAALGFVAEDRRKYAVSAQQAASAAAITGFLRTVGSSTGIAPFSFDQLDAMWELAALPPEAEEIRQAVLVGWFEDETAFAKLHFSRGRGMKAALGISPQRHAQAAELLPAIVPLLKSVLKDSSFHDISVTQASGEALAEIAGTLPVEEASEISQFLQAILRDCKDHYRFKTLCGVLGRMGAILSPAEVEEASRIVLETMKINSNAYYTVSGFADALNSLGEHVPAADAAEAARMLVGAIDDSLNANSLGAIGNSIIGLSENLSDEGAAEIAQRLKDAIKNAVDSHRRHALAPALAKLGQRLPPRPAAAIAWDLVVAMSETNDQYGLNLMATALGDLGKVLDPSHVDVIAGLIVKTMEESENFFQQSYLAQVLGQLGEHLTPEETAEGARLAIGWLTAETGASAIGLATAGQALEQLCGRVSEEDASDLARRLLSAMNEASHWNNRLYLGLAYGKLAEKLPGRDVAEVARLLVAEMEGTSDASRLNSLCWALGNLGDRLPAEAAADCARIVIAAMEKADPADLGPLSNALSSLREKLPAEAAREGFRFLSILMTNPSTPSQNNGLAGALGGLSEGLGPGMAVEAARYLVITMDSSLRSQQMNFNHSHLVKIALSIPQAEETAKYGIAGLLRPATSGALSSGALGEEDSEPRKLFRNYCSSLDKQQLAELLKWPTCVGDAEADVLAELEKKSGAKFGGELSAFVSQAASLGIKNLDGPAVRPTAEEALKELQLIEDEGFENLQMRAPNR